MRGSSFQARLCRVPTTILIVICAGRAGVKHLCDPNIHGVLADPSKYVCVEVSG